MGAGKTSVGRALGEKLNCAFEDLDDRIERSEGRTIAEIFRASGEAEFRRVERTALCGLLEELADDETRVVGLGGGAFVQKENEELLGASGVLTVFLDAPVEELWQRCVKQSSEQELQRPLLQSMEQFQKLFDGRHASYLKASLRVKTDGRTVDALAREIAQAIRLKNLQPNLRKKKEGLTQ